MLNQGDPDFEGGKHGCIFEAYDAAANNDNFSRIEESASAIKLCDSVAIELRSNKMGFARHPAES